MELIIAGVIIAVFFGGRAIISRKIKQSHKNCPHSIKLMMKLNKLVSGEQRILVSGQVFTNENNEDVREIKVINKGISTGEYGIESEEIKKIMMELHDDDYFLEADKVIFRYYDDGSKGNVLKPEKLKLSVIYDVDTIKKTEWSKLNKEDVIGLGNTLSY